MKWHGEFKVDKECKGSRRYAYVADPTEDDPPEVASIYIRRGEFTQSDRLRVTIETD